MDQRECKLVLTLFMYLSVNEVVSDTESYGGPEGPCPLPISTFPITNFEFSHYQLPILAFLITKFEFSHF